MDLLLSDDPNVVEVGEYLGSSDHNIVYARNLLRVRVQDCRVRLLDLRKTNLKGMRRELGDEEWERLTIGLGEMGKLHGANVQSKYILMRCKMRRKRSEWSSSKIKNACD